MKEGGAELGLERYQFHHGLSGMTGKQLESGSA